MSQPLVSIICLCYNQSRYVVEAINSVLAQTYPNIELIVVDDASTDNSREVIEQAVASHPSIKTIFLKKNVGNCAAFNVGFRESKGSYLIDLAADDMLTAQRVTWGVEEFTKRSDEWGVQFGDAVMTGRGDEGMRLHSARFPHATIPEGDIYIDVISRYFICSPTMMIRRVVLEKLGGYDEMLAYEDFDFWVRSARYFKYFYTPEVLAIKRLVAGSLSEKQFMRNSPQQWSTWQVCEKIHALNRTAAEKRALKARIGYELTRALWRGDWKLAGQYARLRFKP